MAYRMICTRCGVVLEKEPVYKCPVCGGVVDIAYTDGQYLKQDAPGVFAWVSLLPVSDDHGISLFEGNTPLIKAPALAKRTGIQTVYIKNEGVNPTGSFKDRALAVGVAKSMELGAGTLIAASSGNGSAAMAAYAARSGQKAIVLVPESTPAQKVTQALCYGAEVFKVPGAYSNCFQLAKEASEKLGFFNNTTTFLNPYAWEGYKTIGYEIFETLGKAPDWIFLPVGAGPMLAAVHKAFCELRSFGLVDRLPRLVCVQAVRCCPIARGVLRGKVEPWEGGEPTVASAIRDDLKGYEEDGEYTLRCIRESGGTAAALSEENIIASVKLMGEEGIFAEPGGAVGAGALCMLAPSGLIRREDTVVIVATGHGLKSPVAAGEEPKRVATADELMRMIDTT